MNADQESLTNSHERLRKDHETLKNNFHGLSDKMASVEKENQNFALKMRLKESELKKLKCEVKSETIFNLKSTLEEQKRTISDYQEKINDLIRKIDALETDNDLKRYFERKVKELSAKCTELELKGEQSRKELDSKQVLINNLKEEIISMKDEQINHGMVPKAASGDIGAVERTSSHATNSCQTIKKLKKVEHDLRALIYQKKYLLNLLGGFQLTERATLALIANMSISIGEFLELFENLAY